MGDVWRAADSTLGWEAAIKLLPAAFAGDADRLARIEREARLLTSLNHPHIDTVYGLHDAGGVRFIAMEHVAGEDLSQRLERGPIPTDDACAVARQITDALESAHESGVIHRDLKPANVKLRPDGRVKVLDFGLAKVVVSTIRHRRLDSERRRRDPAGESRHVRRSGLPFAGWSQRSRPAH